MQPDGRPSGPGRPKTARVFFALWPEAGVRSRLGQVATELGSALGGRASRPETLHLTLAFLGDIPLDRLPALAELGSTVTGSPFVLTLDRLGYWEHNHILWAGCARVPPALPALVSDLVARLKGVGLAGKADGARRFFPHVTLARRVVEKPSELPGLPVLEWPVSRFVLVRSRLSPAGPAYETLGQWPLLQ